MGASDRGVPSLLLSALTLLASAPGLALAAWIAGLPLGLLPALASPPLLLVVLGAALALVRVRLGLAVVAASSLSVAVLGATIAWASGSPALALCLSALSAVQLLALIGIAPAAGR